MITTLVRMAARLCVRNRGRTAFLVLAMAFPVALTAGIGAVKATSQFEPGELRALYYGQSVGKLIRDTPTGPLLTVNDLPPGLIATPEIGIDSLAVEAKGGRRIQTDPTLVLDISNPLNRGRVKVMQGQPASTQGTISISEAVADVLMVQPGDHVTVTTPPDDGGVSQRLVVAAVVRFPLNTSAKAALLPSLPDGAHPQVMAWVIGGHPTSEWQHAMAAKGLVWTPSTVIGVNEGSGLSAVELSLGTGLLVEVVLVAAASFLITARGERTNREVLCTLGAPPIAIRCMFVFYVLLLWLPAAGLGALAGLGAAAAAIPRMQRQAHADWGRFAPGWGSLVIIWAAGAVALAIVAFVTSGAAGGGSSRRCPQAARRRWGGVAAVCAVAGLGLLALDRGRSPLVLVGLGTGLLGWVIGSASVARRLRSLPSGRGWYVLLVSQLTSSPARLMTCAGAAAVLTVLSVFGQSVAHTALTRAVAVSASGLPEATSVVTTSQKPSALILSRHRWRGGDPLLLGPLSMPGRGYLVAHPQWTSCRLVDPGADSFECPAPVDRRAVATATLGDVERLTGVTLSPEQRRAYVNGHLVVASQNSSISAGNEITLARSTQGLRLAPLISLPAVQAKGPARRDLPAAYVSPERARSVGAVSQTYQIVVDTPPYGTLSPTAFPGTLSVATGQPHLPSWLPVAGSAAVTALLSLVVASGLVMLLAVWLYDVRRELAILSALGAEESYLHRLVGGYAAVVAAIGVLGGQVFGWGLVLATGSGSTVTPVVTGICAVALTAVMTAALSKQVRKTKDPA